ncbi:MAG: ATP-binding protein, partial [Bacteroidota bacterium]
IAEWPGTGVFVVDAEGIRLVSSGQVISADLIYSQPTNAVFPLAEDSLLCVTPRTLKLLVKEGGGDWLATDWELSLPAEDHYFYLPRFLRTPQGEIWLTIGSVIWSISPNLEESIAYSPREILGEVCGDCKVYSLFYDREGNHWWGTNRGLFQLTPAINFRDIGLAKLGEQLPNVREILRVGTDLWLATNRGLFVWSGHSNEKPQLVDIVSYHSLHQANDGYVYTVEEHVDRGVLHRFNPIAKKRDWGGRQPPVLPKGQHWKITEDQRGRLWISRWNQLSCYDPASHQAFSIHLQRENKNLPLGIIDLFIDQEDNLWVGNLYAGLIKIPAISENQRGKRLHFDQFLTDPTTSNSISTNLIQQIYQSQDGTIWVGTDAGLNSYQSEDASFRRFLRNEQMIDDKILSITSDQKGKLWMGTVSHGIMSFDPVEERFDNYTQQDGLYGDAMLLSAVFRDQDGSIWFGGQDGLQHFYPSQVARKPPLVTPNLVWLSLERFEADTTIVDRFPQIGLQPTMPIHLRPNQYGLTVNMATLQFRSPQSIRYHFQLKGFHKQWLPPSESGRLTLSNLPPGDYQLLVAATDEHENWRSEHPPIFLRVHPPWYRSTMAYLLYIITGIGLILSFYRSQLKRRLAEVERIRVEEVAQEKLDWFHRIAHEFRTPLTIIGGAVDQLRGKAMPEQYGKLQQIDQQNAYLDRQITQILDMASLRAEGPGLHPTTGDFVAFQRYLLQSFASLAEEKHIDLVFTTTYEQLVFSFDEDYWRKITGNLLINALKFTPDGGHVELTLELIYQNSFQELLLSVSDTGDGMSPAFQEQLFQPFAREHTQRPGTGLGLALTHELVQLLGGKLSVDSIVGKGSRFTVSLPIEEAVITKLEATNEVAGNEQTDRPLILLAEDHPEVLSYLRYCLGNDYRLRTATNGQVAWELCQREIPDLVVSDVIMPGLTGFEFLVQLRQTPATDHIPVILLTAKADEEAKLAGVQRGADVFLAKPFRREE